MELNVPLPEMLTRRNDGEIVVTGTRVTLYLVDFYRRQYGSLPLLAEHYPHIPLETLEAVVGFCEENPGPMREYSANYEDDLERLRATVGQTLNPDELRQRRPVQTPAA